MSSCKSTKTKKRNRNRFRKVYPFLRFKPVNEYVLDKPTTIEVGEVAFSNTSGPVTFTYCDTYNSVPVITAIAVDSSSNNTANVNIFISAITTTQVTFKSSQAFTGKVHFQIIHIET